MKFKIATITAAAMFASAWTASATLTVNSGDIYTIDPTATSYGAVRYKDFPNQDVGAQFNVYLGTPDLGAQTQADGRQRVNTTYGWSAGSHAFSFEYRPTAGPTDTILASVGALTPWSRIINDPSASVNFLSFWIHNTERTIVNDGITVNLTDLGGNSLSPSSISLNYPPGGDANWYITDPTLLANGFILSGSIALSGVLDKGESDKIDIAFGHTAVPEPTTMIAGALLLLPFGISTLRRLRRK